MIVWSELTFFNKSPTLSLFAVFINAAKANYDYLAIEVCLLAADVPAKSIVPWFGSHVFVVQV